MRIVKLALISGVLLFIMATLFSLLIPSRIRLSKAINIRAPQDTVLNLVRNTDRWKEWHPGFMPHEKEKKVKEIRISTTSSTDSTLVMELKQGNKPPLVNGWNIYKYPQADSLTLQWYMDIRLKWYPWQKFGSLFFESTYGNMMKEGLEHIKKRSELAAHGRFQP